MITEAALRTKLFDLDPKWSEVVALFDVVRDVNVPKRFSGADGGRDRVFDELVLVLEGFGNNIHNYACAQDYLGYAKAIVPIYKRVMARRTEHERNFGMAEEDCESVCSGRKSCATVRDDSEDASTDDTGADREDDDGFSEGIIELLNGESDAHIRQIIATLEEHLEERRTVREGHRRTLDRVFDGVGMNEAVKRGAEERVQNVVEKCPENPPENPPKKPPARSAKKHAVTGDEA